MKRQRSEWEKIFADKGLISKIYKQLLQFNKKKKKKKTQSKNGQETYIGISPKKAYRWPTPHEKMLKITIREIQIKTTMRYRLTVVRMAIIKNIYKQQMLEKMWRKGNHPTMLTGMQIAIATIKKQYGGSSKN